MSRPLDSQQGTAFYGLNVLTIYVSILDVDLTLAMPSITYH
jgi:hypothetical protein